MQDVNFGGRLKFVRVPARGRGGEAAGSSRDASVTPKTAPKSGREDSTRRGPPSTRLRPRRRRGDWHMTIYDKIITKNDKD